jgi:hypothetical protein
MCVYVCVCVTNDFSKTSQITVTVKTKDMSLNIIETPRLQARIQKF